MKAKEIVRTALSLMGHVNSAGAVDENREMRYFGIAPACLTVLLMETADLSNRAVMPQPVTSLDQDLDINDDTARRFLPFGLVMHFSLIDRDSGIYNHFSKLYFEQLLPSIKPDEVQIADYYGICKDSTLQ